MNLRVNEPLANCLSNNTSQDNNNTSLTRISIKAKKKTRIGQTPRAPTMLQI